MPDEKLKVATIDDLCPISTTPACPHLYRDGDRIILSVMDERGRMMRLSLSPFQFGTLAGACASITAEHASRFPLT